MRRLLAIGGVALLHVLVYFVVTRLTLLRPPGAFIDPQVALDDRIPHLAWTWPAYWLPYILEERVLDWEREAHRAETAA